MTHKLATAFFVQIPFEGRIQQAIPQSAFLDAINDYVNNSEINDDGSMIQVE
jgi:hypothetical protein